MASSNVNTLIDQIIKDQKEMLQEKEKQDAILCKLLQILSVQKIADPSDQHIDNQHQSDSQVQSDNQNQSDNQVQADDLSLLDVAEDFAQSTTTAATIIESPESHGQSVLKPNSPESCDNVQCLESLSPQVQVPESPESSVIAESFEQSENQDHDSKVNSERILLEYIQLEYSGNWTTVDSEENSEQSSISENQNEATSERSPIVDRNITFIECNEFCSITDCHQNNTILEAIDK